MLQSILAQEDFATGSIHTRFVDAEMERLVAASASHPRFVTPTGGVASTRAFGAADDAERPVGPDGSIGLATPIQGTLVAVEGTVGDQVGSARRSLVVEAMKLQHDIKADRSGVVCAVSMSVGDVVREGYPIVFIEEIHIEGDAIVMGAAADPYYLRTDMQQLNERIAQTLDATHEDAVAARHGAGRRTARENIDDLVDAGSFRETGPAATGSSWCVTSRFPWCSSPRAKAGPTSVHAAFKPVSVWTGSCSAKFAKLSGLVPLVGVNDRALLWRERDAARGLRCHHRHGEGRHRHGRRTGCRRGQWHGYLLARRDRLDVVPGDER